MTWVDRWGQRLKEHVMPHKTVASAVQLLCSKDKKKFITNKP